MIAYASRTGTKRNLTALRQAQWRLLVSAASCLRTENMPYALDNGAWTAYRQGRTFDEPAFVRALRKLGAGADWCIAPDIVAGGHASLDLSLRWMPMVLSECAHALLAVQDGLTPADVASFVGERVGIFVGGSTAWKLATMPLWGAFGKQAGLWVHVGRVNTVQRIYQCGLAGVTSFDGSSVSRYAQTLPPLDYARHQLAFTFSGGMIAHESLHTPEWRSDRDPQRRLPHLSCAQDRGDAGSCPHPDGTRL